MTSADLPDSLIWSELSALWAKGAPNSRGVYVLRLARAIARLKGQSDVLYVGRTRMPKATLRSMLTHHVRPRVNEKDIGYRVFRILQEVPDARVEFTCIPFPTNVESGLYEASLLRRYERDHLEFPPLNRQEAGRFYQQVRRAFKNLTPAEVVGVLKREQSRARSKRDQEPPNA